MKITDLDATFISNKAGERIAVGFLCPGCKAEHIYVPFADPSFVNTAGKAVNWTINQTADLERVTLSPSVDFQHKVDGRVCHWHGWVRDGEIVDA